MRNPALAMLFAAALMACGGGSDYPSAPANNTPSTPNNPSSPSPSPGSNQVQVRDNQYTPGQVSVTTGTTVTWTWAAGNYTAHSVTFEDGAESSVTQGSGTHQRTFTTAGTFAYHCAVHGAAMSGTVVVTAP